MSSLIEKELNSFQTSEYFFVLSSFPAPNPISPDVPPTSRVLRTGLLQSNVNQENLLNSIFKQYIHVKVLINCHVLFITLIHSRHVLFITLIHRISALNLKRL